MGSRRPARPERGRRDDLGPLGPGSPAGSRGVVGHLDARRQQECGQRLAPRENGVVYYASFCKALSLALRLGYIAASSGRLKPLLRENIYSVLTTGALNELVLLEVLSAGRRPCWSLRSERG
ncbi:hypothetical protein [Sorangium cellulosum]|uniref:Uncharacterized protein n=1 Tax=Sorangium cellulosum TaxID=56 RepID=A0A150QJJ9_SORCE|nr:hypothetical protein [Sorangium cellulosum]KYF68130.1 hypothetical protein BE15_38125 [Sorangium cellulosum]